MGSPPLTVVGIMEAAFAWENAAFEISVSSEKLFFHQLGFLLYLDRLTEFDEIWMKYQRCLRTLTTTKNLDKT